MVYTYDGHWNVVKKRSNILMTMKNPYIIKWESEKKQVNSTWPYN